MRLRRVRFVGRVAIRHNATLCDGAPTGGARVERVKAAGTASLPTEDRTDTQSRAGGDR